MKHPRTRAERRANQQAVDAVTRRMAAEWGIAGRWHAFRHNRQPCSCPMCGNTRTLEGPTLQERHHYIKLNEGLDEWISAPENERDYAKWERVDQSRFMKSYQHILHTALDFACRYVVIHDPFDYEVTAMWYNADYEPVAYKERNGIEVANRHHDFVWSVFKLFL